MSTLRTNAVESITGTATDFPNSLKIQGTLVPSGSAATEPTSRFPYVVGSVAELASVPEGLRVDGAAFSVVNADGFRKYVWDGNNESFADGVQIVTASGTTTGRFVSTAGSTSSSFEVTVGSGGNFESINDALKSVSKIQSLYSDAPVRIIVRLLSGFVMSEQVLVESIDLSYITIVSDDAEVVVSRQSVTQDVTVEFFTIRAAFVAYRGGALPIISCLFTMDQSGTANDQSGIYALDRGQVTITSGSGFKNATAFNMRIALSSFAQAEGANLSGAGHSGAEINYASIANCRGVNANNCGIRGITGSNFGFVDARSASVNNTGLGIYAASSGQINARGATAQNCEVGVRALHGCAIDARDVNVSGASVWGVDADGACMISFEGGIANNVAQRCINITSGSTVNAKGADLSNSARLVVLDGGVFVGTNANLTGTGVAVRRAEAYLSGADCRVNGTSEEPGDIQLESGAIVHTNNTLGGSATPTNINVKAGLLQSPDRDTASGIWTPTISGSTTAGNHTYLNQAGTWEYLSNGMVFIEFDIHIDAFDANMAGIVEISGLPFFSSSSAFTPVVNFSDISSVVFTDQCAGAVVEDRIRVRNIISNAVVQSVAAGDIGAGTRFRGSAVYRIAKI